MTHYLADWIGRRETSGRVSSGGTSSSINFNVERLAEQLESVGASTISSRSARTRATILSPNATYDRFVGREPSRCSRRDLVADLHEPLRKRNIRLMVYLPAGAPNGDREREERSSMAERPASESRVSSEVGAGDSRMVDAMGRASGRLVVRRLLLAEHDVPRRRVAQLRKLRRCRAGRQPEQHRGVQSGRLLACSFDHAARGLHSGRDQRRGRHRDQAPGKRHGSTARRSTS